jgi:hypothetical protein
VAVQKQAARAELAACRQRDYAIVLLDLVKAFERVPYDWLVRQAQRYGYSLSLLRLTLAAYQLARVVGCNVVYAAAFIATHGITAGSTFATIELQVLLIEWIDEAAALCIAAALAVYVDDIGVETDWQELAVLSSLVEVVQCIVQNFQFMRLTFFHTENVCSSSRIRLGKAVAAALPSLAISCANRHLPG